LLERLIHLNKEGRPDVTPSIITIACVLEALAKSGAVSRAEELLNRVENNQLDTTLNHLCLDTISYNVVIDGYAMSREKGAAQRAEEIFKRMEAAYKNGNDRAKPNTFSFIAGKVVEARCPHILSRSL